MSNQRTAPRLITTWLVLASIVCAGAAPLSQCAGQSRSHAACETSPGCCCRRVAERPECCCQPEPEPPVPSPAAADDPGRMIAWLLGCDAGPGSATDAASSRGPVLPDAAFRSRCLRSLQALFCVWRK